MKKYVLKRLLQLIPILLAITFLSYGMMRVAGSDVVEQKMENTGSDISQEVVDAAREELGLDKPFLTQYVVWLGGLLRGDMGTSYVSGKPVFSTFISKLPATLLLTVTSILLTILISVPLGILSAVHQNRCSDYLIRTCSFIGNSLPNFFVSLLLMYLFAIRLGWFPVIATGVSLKSVAMPAITLAIAMSAKYLRQVRATVLDELSKDYVVGAKARGVKFSRILWGSVMKASLVTITTLLMLSVGSLLGGTAIVESIFMWDGVGKMAVDAISMNPGFMGLLRPVNGMCPSCGMNLIELHPDMTVSCPLCDAHGTFKHIFGENDIEWDDYSVKHSRFTEFGAMLHFRHIDYSQIDDKNALENPKGLDEYLAKYKEYGKLVRPER